MALDIVNNGEQTVGRAEYGFGGCLVLTKHYRDQHQLYYNQTWKYGKEEDAQESGS